ncbi:MAG: energy transducer TonB [Acidobacteria bacterium]|nr:energy transducer TonB [Acidobacteriota bacterium]
MSHELFEDFVSAPVAIRSRKSRTMPISMGVHAVLVAVVITMSMVGSDLLPAMPVMLAFVAPAPPPALPPATPLAPQPAHAAAAAPTVPAAHAEAAPVDAPAGIKPDSGIEHDPGPVIASGVEGGLPGGGAGPIVSGLNGPPSPPVPAAPTGPMRLWSGVTPPTKIKDALPIYPYFATVAKVGGTVIVEAVIGPDGRVSDARILRSIPMLDRAALDAVLQWIYTPTLFNGVPVAVIMTVTVTFKLK